MKTQTNEPQINESKTGRSTVPKINKPSKLPYPLNFYSTSIGKKWVMAITGIMLMGFVFFHMLGNLKVFLSPEAINHYGEWLREILVPILPHSVALWIMRIGLIFGFGFHIHSAYSLTLINKKANGTKYQSPQDYVAANFASRTMRYTGIIIGLFILWHLADLTWGWAVANPEFIRGDIAHNLNESLTRLPVFGIYVAANIALGLHLYHGGWSLFQSLGINNPKLNYLRKGFAASFAFIVTVGNILIVSALYFGLFEGKL